MPAPASASKTSVRNRRVEITWGTFLAAGARILLLCLVPYQGQSHLGRNVLAAEERKAGANPTDPFAGLAEAWLRQKIC